MFFNRCVLLVARRPRGPFFSGQIIANHCRTKAKKFCLTEGSVHIHSLVINKLLNRLTAWGAFRSPPMTPGIALKIAAARYAPLRRHLAGRADSTSLSRPPSGRRPGGQPLMCACVLANFLYAPQPPRGESFANMRQYCRVNRG